MREQETIQQILDGKSALFGPLSQPYAPRIYGMALRMTGNQTDAEDIVQEVFLAAFSKLHTFRGDSAFGTWIYRIALNTTYMSLRDRKHVTEENLDDYLPQFDTSGKMKGMAKSIILDPEDETIRGQVRAILEDAIARLPANYRVVLVARDIAELTTEETAEALDLSIAAVKSRLHRARLFLRQRLERKFGKRLSVGEWLKARKM